MHPPLPTYALITPARNEAAFIENTIQCVIAQTVLPVRWVIVSDGSTDGTDDIVRQYMGNNSWIQLLRMPERRDRNFAAKVHAFNAGYATVSNCEYGIIANLDADVTFDKGHFEFLLTKFAENPRLGVGGTPFREGLVQYDYRFTSIEHVSGACQMFRRECFEDIGGYVPIELGGIDLAAVLTARMKGWQTRVFPERFYLHHRKIGTAKRSVLMVSFKGGQGDYRLGTHPAWAFLRTLYQSTKRPLVLGACFRLAGFLWAMVRQVDKVLPRELIQFRRAEQMRRLRAFAKTLIRQRSSAPESG